MFYLRNSIFFIPRKTPGASYKLGIRKPNRKYLNYELKIYFNNFTLFILHTLRKGDSYV